MDSLPEEQPPVEAQQFDLTITGDDIVMGM
jgi:hypothetical protein